MYAHLGSFGRSIWGLVVFGLWVVMMVVYWTFASSAILAIETKVYPGLAARTLSPIVGDVALLGVMVVTCIAIPIVLTVGLVRVNRNLKGEVVSDDD